MERRNFVSKALAFSLTFLLVCAPPSLAHAQEAGAPPALGGGQGASPGSVGGPASIPRSVFVRPPPAFVASNKWMSLDTTMKLKESQAYLERYRQLREFGRCAQRVSPKGVTNLLSQPLESSGERRAAQSLMRYAPGCLGSAMMVSTRFLRGALAEAVLEEYRLDDPDIAKRYNTDRMDHFLKAAPGTDSEDDENALALTRHVQCQVIAAPGLARKLLDAEPNSRDEEAFEEELHLASSKCGKTDANNQFSGLIYRSYLAEALYHWTRTAGNFRTS